MWKFDVGRIKGLREMKGLKQTEFAKSLGVHKQHVSAWESGSVNPSIASLLRMCNAHGCNPGYFFTENGKTDNQSGKIEE